MTPVERKVRDAYSKCPDVRTVADDLSMPYARVYYYVKVKPNKVKAKDLPKKSPAINRNSKSDLPLWDMMTPEIRESARAFVNRRNRSLPNVDT